MKKTNSSNLGVQAFPVESVMRKLRNHFLTPEQHERYDTIRWLIGHGPRGTGRTFLMALAFVERSFINGEWVQIYDHHSQHQMASRDLMTKIQHIINQVPFLVLKIRGVAMVRPEILVEFNYEKEYPEPNPIRYDAGKGIKI